MLQTVRHLIHSVDECLKHICFSTPPYRHRNKRSCREAPGPRWGCKKEVWPPTLHFIVFLSQAHITSLERTHTRAHAHTLSVTDLLFSGFTLWRFNLDIRAVLAFPCVQITLFLLSRDTRFLQCQRPWWRSSPEHWTCFIFFQLFKATVSCNMKHVTSKLVKEDEIIKLWSLRWLICPHHLPQEARCIFWTSFSNRFNGRSILSSLSMQRKAPLHH